MNTDQHPQIISGFTVEEFDNEILLYNKGNTKAVYLNDAAYAVWLLCQESMSIRQIIACLQERYPEQGDTISEDVFSALNMLQDSGVISLA